jgi:hypothetical protein
LKLQSIAKSKNSLINHHVKGATAAQAQSTVIDERRGKKNLTGILSGYFSLILAASALLFSVEGKKKRIRVCFLSNTESDNMINQ